jgi:serine/threonine-protein kinase HipA
MARYASYEDLATIIRHRFVSPKAALKELFARMAFNVLCGNIDDHARNHAAFWNGSELSLTPAYDICPQARGRRGKPSDADHRRRTHQPNRALPQGYPLLLIDVAEATSLIAGQIKVIKSSWKEVCDDAALSEVDRNFIWRRQILNALAFVQAPPEIAALAS